MTISHSAVDKQFLEENIYVSGRLLIAYTVYSLTFWFSVGLAMSASRIYMKILRISWEIGIIRKWTIIIITTIFNNDK